MYLRNTVSALSLQKSQCFSFAPAGVSRGRKPGCQSPEDRLKTLQKTADLYGTKQGQNDDIKGRATSDISKAHMEATPLSPESTARQGNQLNVKQTVTNRAGCPIFCQISSRLPVPSSSTNVREKTRNTKLSRTIAVKNWPRLKTVYLGRTSFDQIVWKIGALTFMGVLVQVCSF